jgi:hypothetical protein
MVDFRGGIIAMEKLICEKFAEWTKNKSEIEARICIFEGIRNIPYAVIPELLDPEKGPIEMLNLNRGSCQPKHFLLEQFYTRLGISILYVRYAYRWTEFEIDYPPKLWELAKKMPLGHHLACKAIIDDKLVLIDATLDPPLEKLGLPVNKNWDGISNQSLPVIPLDEEIYHPSERVGLEPPSFTEIELRFYTEMNQWLDEVRGKP